MKNGRIKSGIGRKLRSINQKKVVSLFLDQGVLQGKTWIRVSGTADFI